MYGKAFAGLVILFAVMASLLFGSAGTLHYWQAWVFLAVYFGASIAIMAVGDFSSPPAWARATAAARVGTSSSFIGELAINRARCGRCWVVARISRRRAGCAELTVQGASC